MVIKVVLTKKAIKDLKKVPHHINWKLQSWIENIEQDGIEETRKISGYHDEPLTGIRREQRSIRLSRSYRAIYMMNHLEGFRIIKILEITHHDY